MKSKALAVTCMLGPLVVHSLFAAIRGYGNPGRHRRCKRSCDCRRQPLPASRAPIRRNSISYSRGRWTARRHA
jgi:hypothetical protein